MGKLSHINSVEKANAVIESVERLWDEGKTIDDYISSSLKKGRIEGRQEPIINLHKKGYKADEIADLIDFDLAFVQDIINNNRG